MSTLQFGGYTWWRREGGGLPGWAPFRAASATVDEFGRLHLRLIKKNGVWYSAEVIMENDRLSFGEYQFQLIGRVDQLDPQVVFSPFNYPTPDVGPDGTNEIDIEFAKWGQPAGTNLNFGVYPQETFPTQLPAEFRQFSLDLGTGDYSTFRFLWKPDRVKFTSTAGHYNSNPYPLFNWTWAPTDLRKIPQEPLPVHINLWLFEGPPTDNQEVEVIVSSFVFTPLASMSPEQLEAWGEEA